MAQRGIIVTSPLSAQDTMSFGNLSPFDRGLRLLVGAAMLALAWSGAAQGLAGRGLEIFAWVPLLTGLAGWSPLYAVLGVHTRKRRLDPKIR